MSTSVVPSTPFRWRIPSPRRSASIGRRARLRCASSRLRHGPRGGERQSSAYVKDVSDHEFVFRTDYASSIARSKPHAAPCHDVP